MYDLSGRTALVTGAAGGGIGKATARRLLVEGANVVVSDPHERRTEETVAAFADEFGADRVMAAILDAGDRAQIDEVLAAARARFGIVDVLVNNAAVNALNPVGDMTPEEWDWAIGVNLSGPWYLCRALLPAMAEQGWGSIVNITSVAGWIHGTNEGPYAGAKAALHQLTRTIATEYGPQGIRCNGVAPGIIHTWFVDAKAPQLLDEAPKTPVRRLGTPEDIANVVAWLVSDESSFVTGETINASGGWYMRP
ncbi:MAG: acetoacetyl-CoA reductase [Acidimicrobiales bacterium]|nr:MAG: acetoacetyl-CoA reductase [Acidimicrobiales bacterium]